MGLTSPNGTQKNGSNSSTVSCPPLPSPPLPPSGAVEHLPKQKLGRYEALADISACRRAIRMAGLNTTPRVQQVMASYGGPTQEPRVIGGRYLSTRVACRPFHYPPDSPNSPCKKLPSSRHVGNGQKCRDPHQPKCRGSCQVVFLSRWSIK